MCINDYLKTVTSNEFTQPLWLELSEMKNYYIHLKLGQQLKHKKYECFRYIGANKMNNDHDIDVNFIHMYSYSEPQIRNRYQKLYKTAVLFLLKYFRCDHKF